MAMMTGEGTESDITADATGAVGNVVAEAHPSFDAAEQLADLERDGVYGAVLIGRITDMPNAIPADADTAYCKVVNDWLAETWGPYLDRVAPGIHLPFKDVAASVAELERAAGMGFVRHCCRTGSSSVPTTWRSGSRSGRPRTACGFRSRCTSAGCAARWSGPA